MPNRRFIQLRALFSFMFDALCDGAISRLGESAFVFLLSRCDPTAMPHLQQIFLYLCGF